MVPGRRAAERRFRAYLRWNAAMMHRAQRPGIGVGGHISSYASAATPLRVGMNHFFRGRTTPVVATTSSSRAMPPRHGMPAFLEGRISSDRLDGFRQEHSHLVDGKPFGLPSYPHPRLMSDFWGSRRCPWSWADERDHQAQFHCHNRGLKDTSQHTWAFLGDGEMVEVESRGALQWAAGEELDNLTFVVNCNPQRLDGRCAATARSSRN